MTTRELTPLEAELLAALKPFADIGIATYPFFRVVIKSERGIARANLANAEQKLADLDLEQPLVEAAIAKLKA